MYQYFVNAIPTTYTDGKGNVTNTYQLDREIELRNRVTETHYLRRCFKYTIHRNEIVHMGWHDVRMSLHFVHRNVTFDATTLFHTRFPFLQEVVIGTLH